MYHNQAIIIDIVLVVTPAVVAFATGLLCEAIVFFKVVAVIIIAAAVIIRADQLMLERRNGLARRDGLR